MSEKIDKMKKNTKRNFKAIEKNQTISSFTSTTSLTFISLISAILLIYLSYISYPASLNYNMMYNWISDLGNQLLNPSGWYFFTLGCLICGLLLIVIFARNSRITLRIFGIIMGIGLLFVGAFSSLFVIQHSLFAQFYFIGSLVCVLLMSFSILPKNIGWIGIAAVILNICFLVFNTQLLEWLTFISNFGFIHIASLTK